MKRRWLIFDPRSPLLLAIFFFFLSGLPTRDPSSSKDSAAPLPSFSSEELLLCSTDGVRSFSHLSFFSFRFVRLLTDFLLHFFSPVVGDLSIRTAEQDAADEHARNTSAPHPDQKMDKGELDV